MLKRTVSTMVALMLVAGVANAAHVIYLSDKGLGEGASRGDLDLTMNLGDSATIHVWVLPDSNPLVGVFLDLATSDASIVSATAGSVPNYDIMFGTYDAGDRYDTPGSIDAMNVTGPPALLCDQMGGLRVEQYGIDAANVGGGPPLDTGYDGTTAGFHFAEITLHADAMGTTNLNLLADFLEICDTSGDYSTTPVQFGSNTAVTLDGGAGVENGTHEGVITVVPEPATMVLLTIGGLGVLLR